MVYQIIRQVLKNGLKYPIIWEVAFCIFRSKLKMWDLIKDYTNAFLGAIALLLSLIFIPEIRNSKKNIFFVLLVCITSTFLGLDKLKRDNCKDVRNQTRTLKDSETIQNINSTLSLCLQIIKGIQSLSRILRKS